MAKHLGPIELERIFLYEENPRHEALNSEPEVIEAGTNPLALLGVVELAGSGSGKKTYQVWEGNRRVCAISRFLGGRTRHFIRQPFALGWAIALRGIHVQVHSNEGA